MPAATLTQVFICAFFAACFLQSGLDKFFDWKANLEWLTGHFSKTIFRTQVPMMLGTVAILEVAGGVACLVAVATLLFGVGPVVIPKIALGLVCVDLLMLFTGQRIAKDYPGAATLATYFVVAVFGLAMTR